MKRGRLNAILAVVVIGLGAVVYFSQKQGQKLPPLTPLKSADVSRIAIEHPDAAAIKLEKNGGPWRLTAPVQAETDPFEVNSLVSLATLETQSKLDPKEVKLADLGLQPPDYTITLNDTRIAFGGTEPLNYRRYVQVGDAIYTIDDPPSAALDQDYSDLVSKELLPAGAQLAKIELPGMTLTRGDTGWTLDPPDPKGTPEALSKIAGAWASARAMWNELEKDAEVKGDPVVLHLKGGGEIHLIVAARDPQLQLSRPDLKVRYFLSKSLDQELFKLPEPAAPKEEEKKKATGPGNGAGTTKPAGDESPAPTKSEEKPGTGHAAPAEGDHAAPPSQ